MTSSPALSFVIPAFNEEDRLATSLELMLEFAERRKAGCQLIVVDDGSHDRTFEVARSFQQSTNSNTVCRVDCHQRPHLGKGSALRFGTFQARAPIVFWVDADCPYSRSFLDLALESLEQGATAAIGARDLPGSSYDPSYSVTRRVLGRLLSHLISWTLPIGILDTQCGFKAFKTRPLQHALAFSEQQGFALDLEVLLLLRRWQLKIERRPVSLIRHHGSKVRLLRDGRAMLLSLSQIRFNLSRGAYPKGLPNPPIPVSCCPVCKAESSRFLRWTEQRRLCKCCRCNAIYEKPKSTLAALGSGDVAICD